MRSWNIVILSAHLSLPACATTGATLGSGVGDSYLDQPPWVAGASLSLVGRDTGRIGHLPIAFQRGAAQPAIFDPRTGRGTPMDTLLEEMNAYLDSLGISAALMAKAGDSAIVPTPAGSKGVPPDVRFGCIPEQGVAGNDCAERGDSALGRGSQRMLLAVGRPSAEWIAWAAARMRENGTARMLVVTLEIGDYLIRQEGLLGTKVVELGTGHRAKLPWLTSLETPVAVMQLTAALVERDGKAVRIGAEGFYPRRTRLVVSAMGGQELLDDDDVRALRGYRREDLPGSPLAWQVALANLVEQVTGKPARR
jgi:hypothetical protein